MSNDGTQTPAAGKSRSDIDAWPPRRESVARFFKYFFLMVALLLTTKIVFDGYSYYVARRSIDTELEAKKISSLEYLNVLQERERALMRQTWETRCNERVEIVLFRVLDALTQAPMLDAYHKQTLDAKGPLIAEIKENGEKFLKRSKEARDFANSATFSVAEFKAKYLERLPTVSETDQGYRDFLVQIEKDLKSYNDLVQPDPDLQKLAAQVEDETKNHWRMQAVRTLEDRLKRLDTETKKTQAVLGTNPDEILARYGVWTDALTGGLSENAIRDEMAVEADKEDRAPLASMNCLQNQDKRTATDANTPILSSVMRWYNARLLTYFNQPPAAQTLFVTLFMGALGGLTVNVLRLSQLGWWRGQKDPQWGEILVSPILGALAALAIYLVGSAGLLLTSDFRASQNGATVLSASFIGLLGFLSGFLYDTAFGRVRRVGQQLFAGDTATDAAPNASEDDRSLAEALKGANASLAAGLLLSRGIGSKLAAESGFTLLVPSDQAIGHMTLAAWNDIADKNSDAFDTWYKHHHASKRVTKKDLAGPPVQPPVQLQLDDGKSVEVKVEGDELKVGATKAMVADVLWKKGVIQILQDDLA
jgi:Fasciclin domain